MNPTFDLNSMHETLRYKPEENQSSLDITIRPDPDTSKHRQKVARLTIGDKNHDFAYQYDHHIFVRHLLGNYPIPVYINGEELERKPWPEAPAIITHRTDSPEETDGRAHHIGPTKPDLVSPAINIDGLNYDLDTYVSNRQPLYIPDDHDSSTLVHTTSSYTVQFRTAIVTTDEQRGQSSFHISDQIPQCTPTKSILDAIKANQTEQIHQAISIIGTPYTLEELQEINLMYDWNYNPVVPKQNVTPVTIGMLEYQGQLKHQHNPSLADRPTKPIHHTVARYLTDHPNLSLLPVRSARKPETQIADITNAIIFISEPEPENTSDRPFVVSTITASIRVVQPGGNFREITIHPNNAFLEDDQNPQPLITVNYQGSVKELHEEMFNAYHQPMFIQRREDDLHDQELDCKLKSLANRMIHGDLKAYQIEVAEYWADFKPRTPIPRNSAGRSITVTIPAEQPATDL